MRNRWRVVAFLAALLMTGPALDACPAIPPGKRVAAKVLTVKGAWRVSGQPAAKVEVGCDLAEEAELMPPKDIRDGYAKIVIVQGETTRIKACLAGEDCGRPLIVDSPAASGGVLQSVINEVMSLFRRDPDKYRAAGGLRDGLLRDAVVRIADGAIDLSPALEGLNGTAVVVLRRIAPVSGGAGARVPMPGLYQISLEGRPENAWVLAVGPEAAAQAIVDEDVKVRGMLDAWSKEADIEERNAQKTFYRGFLQAAAGRLHGR